jgi:hypothetical protein
MVGVQHLHPRMHSTEPMAQLNHEKSSQRFKKVQYDSSMRRYLLQTSIQKVFATWYMVQSKQD